MDRLWNQVIGSAEIMCGERESDKPLLLVGRELQYQLLDGTHPCRGRGRARLVVRLVVCLLGSGGRGRIWVRVRIGYKGHI